MFPPPFPGFAWRKGRLYGPLTRGRSGRGRKPLPLPASGGITSGAGGCHRPVVEPRSAAEVIEIDPASRIGDARNRGGRAVAATNLAQTGRIAPLAHSDHREDEEGGTKERP